MGSQLWDSAAGSGRQGWAWGGGGAGRPHAALRGRAQRGGTQESPQAILLCGSFRTSYQTGHSPSTAPVKLHTTHLDDRQPLPGQDVSACGAEVRKQGLHFLRVADHSPAYVSYLNCMHMMLYVCTQVLLGAQPC